MSTVQAISGFARTRFHELIEHLRHQDVIAAHVDSCDLLLIIEHDPLRFHELLDHHTHHAAVPAHKADLLVHEGSETTHYHVAILEGDGAHRQPHH